MKKVVLYFSFSVFTMASAYGQLIPNLGGQRTGISALDFLKLDVDPRADAMAGAQVSYQGDAYSANWNPASMTDVKGVAFATSDKVLPADVQNSYVSAMIPDKRQGCWGFTLTNMNSGAIDKTTEFQPQGTGQVVYDDDFALGVSYAKELSDMFSLGVTAKYIRQQMAEFNVNTAAIDLAFLYKTDYRDLRFAIMIQSLGPTSTLTGSFDQTSFITQTQTTSPFSASTVFKMGFSFTPYDDGARQFRMQFQLNHPGDNAENIAMGMEYNYLKIVSFRAGYNFNFLDHSYPSFGIGIHSHIGRNIVMIDYAFMPTNYMGNVQNIGISMNINKVKKDEPR